MSERSGGRRRELAVLLIVVVGAALLRIWGVGFGLPHTYHPDEHQYVDTALQVIEGQLNPGRFNNPSLYKYALAAVDGVWLAVARSTGAVESRTAFLALAQSDPTSSYLLARLVTAIIGALTAVLVYLLALEAGAARNGGSRSLDSRRAALVAAVLLAGTYLHARQSHFAVSDVPATALVAAALLFSMRVLRHARPRDYAIAGLLAGLAAATKYSGGLVVVSLVAAHLLAEGAPVRAMPRRLFDRRLLLAAASFAAAFLLAVPFAVLDWPAFVEDVALLIERGRTGFKGLALSPDVGWVFYAKTLWWGMGPALLAASLGGIVLALVRHRRADLVLVLFPLVLYAWMGRQLLMFARFMLPALPVLVVLAAELLVWLCAKLPDRDHLREAALVALTTVVLLVPVASTLRFDWLLTQPDTRDVAQQWIERNVPEGTKVLVHSNGPELAAIDRPEPGAVVPYELTRMGTTGLSKAPLQHYVDEGYEYFVLSSFSYDRRLLDPAKDQARREFYERLDSEFELVETFAPYASGADTTPFIFAQVYGPATGLWELRRPGPTIKVYRVTRE